MRIACIPHRLAVLGFAIMSVLLVGAPNASAAPAAQRLVPFHATFQETIVDFSCVDAACEVAHIVAIGHGTATHSWARP